MDTFESVLDKLRKERPELFHPRTSTSHSAGPELWLKRPWPKITLLGWHLQSAFVAVPESVPFSQIGVRELFRMAHQPLTKI